MFADKNLKKLEEGFDDVREQIDNTITHINHLNLKTLSNEEIYNLSKILHSNSEKCLAAEKAVDHLFTEIKYISEDNQAFVWD